MELPAGFAGFVPADQPGTWKASAPDSQAQFVVGHLLLENAGAIPEKVELWRRDAWWEPLLSGSEGGHRSTPWKGAWAGENQAAGLEIEYSRAGRPFRILERLVVLGDHLVLANWEGPLEQRGAALRALGTFRIPPAWRPGPAMAEDREHGLGPEASILPPLGRLDLKVDLTRLRLEGRIQVDLTYAPAPPAAKPVLFRIPPSGEERSVSPDGEGRFHLAYSLEWNDREAAARLGWIEGPRCLAALQGAWVAVPVSGAGTLLPPPWRLRVAVPAQETVLSAREPSGIHLEGKPAVRVFQFPEVSGGRSWPFFLMGQFNRAQAAGRTIHLRVGARAHGFEDPLRWLDRLTKVLEDWLPGSVPDWRAATFPGAGDRVLDGLLILDENHGWFQDPLDSDWQGQSRRTGLAEFLARIPFQLQLRGVGSARPFLTASLSEFAAWRLLQAAGRSEDAARLRRSWVDRETASGPLPRPLSALPAADLFGPARLLTRGALTWQAIEEKAGREVLDAVLQEFLARGGTWTTEDLKKALQGRQGEGWEAFFRKHLYGLAPPPLPGR